MCASLGSLDELSELLNKSLEMFGLGYSRFCVEAVEDVAILRM
jgi:hypothetical protein